ncbi:MAG: hypothetical protein GEU74_09585 [Nitriliruptorales bacterium]|nr:hypothetical protein [Nitriliruptorales bacterium]
MTATGARIIGHAPRILEEAPAIIAAGQALGISPEATTRQHLRPGVVYRPVRDAQPVAVWMAWWRDSPPAHASTLVHLACDLYATTAK